MRHRAINPTTERHALQRNWVYPKQSESVRRFAAFVPYSHYLLLVNPPPPCNFTECNSL